jgi:hypothetical protein
MGYPRSVAGHGRAAYGGITVNGQRAVLVHATSAQGPQHEIHDGVATLAGGVFHAQVKLLRNAALRRLLAAALNRWSRAPIALACAAAARRG